MLVLPLKVALRIYSKTADIKWGGKISYNKDGGERSKEHTTGRMRRSLKRAKGLWELSE